MSKTKSFSIRTDETLINDFNKACVELPVSFKSRALIESYMKYIVTMSKEYKKTGTVKIGFLMQDGEMVLVSKDSKMNQLTVFDD